MALAFHCSWFHPMRERTSSTTPPPTKPRSYDSSRTTGSGDNASPAPLTLLAGSMNGMFDFKDDSNKGRYSLDPTTGLVISDEDNDHGHGGSW